MSGQDGLKTIHANAVLAGNTAIVIRGAPASGKSQLTLDILSSAPPGAFAMLVADDRVALKAAGGRLLVSALPNAGGLVEMRGFAIVRLPHEPLARAGLVVDLCAAEEIERLPGPAARQARLLGIALPRLAIASHDPRAPQLCWRAVRLVEEGRLPADVELLL